MSSTVLYFIYFLLLSTLSVSQPLTTIAELTQFCKANILTNTPLSTAYHTQCQSASNHHDELPQLCKANTVTTTPLSTPYHTQCQSASITTISELIQFCKFNTLTTTSLSTAYHTQCQSASNHHCWEVVNSYIRTLWRGKLRSLFILKWPRPCNTEGFGPHSLLDCNGLI